MSALQNLPKPSKKKKINIDEFVKLANRVRKIFEEEKEYLKKHENNNSSGLLSNS